MAFDADYDESRQSRSREEVDEEYSDSRESSAEPYYPDLDDIIKAYIEQMNGDPVEYDDSYYEKIGELSVVGSGHCTGGVRHLE